MSHWAKIKANTSKHKAMSYGRMKQEEERLGKEIDELMQQAEVVDAEEDEASGADHNGYNLPEQLQEREERLEKICSLREAGARKEGGTTPQRRSNPDHRRQRTEKLRRKGCQDDVDEAR
jgi:hypothetical protein